MKKLCFVLSASSGIGYTSIYFAPFIRKNDPLKELLSSDYDVSFNSYEDQAWADYLVVPTPGFPFEKEADRPVISIPSRLFVTKDYPAIKACIDQYFSDEKK